MSIHARILAILLALGAFVGVALANQPARAQGAHRTAASSMGGQGMGAAAMREVDEFVGYYDSHLDTYVSTDTSNKAQAAAWHINFSAALAAAHGSPAIYLVQGRAAPKQVAVFGSQPGEKDYSPLWTEVRVNWKAGAKPVLLTSDNQILSLSQKGKLTVHPTSTILNCPIIKVGKG
ncbi:MAG TPA: hypothetical protein VF221_19575 [Chloroflexota bacterium]